MVFVGIYCNYWCFLDSRKQWVLLNGQCSPWGFINAGVPQLIAINHNIFKGFDNGLEIRGVFLDISKAFDKLWHEGLIYKLRYNGICGNLLQLLISFLVSRKQQVLLNGQCSSGGFNNAGVPQVLILKLLLFLIYINNLAENL